MNERKVNYLTREGSVSTAYIDMDTGEGTDKRSDIPVILKWHELTETWQQIDAWEWEWNEYTGEFERTLPPLIPVDPAELHRAKREKIKQRLLVARSRRKK